jgi:hypothetical protein
MWHSFYTHVIQGDSKLLIVGNQIDILIPDLFLIICVVSTQMDHVSPF